MVDALYVLAVVLLERFNTRRDAEIRFLREENRILRSRIKTKGLILSPEERHRLMKIGAELKHEVKHLISIVQYRTYQRWLKEKAEGKPPGRVGRRSKITKPLRDLIVHMAKADPSWGSRRISGELYKLAISVSKTTVRRILADHGIYPEPGKGKRKQLHADDSTWDVFIKLHLNTIVACDFFCKEIIGPFGCRDAYCLFFIHLGTRKVFLSHSTFNPTGEWVKQQARNLIMWLEDNELECKYLIRDRDGKFQGGFDAVIESANVRIKLSPPRSPNLNSYAESWVSSAKREVLNHFWCFHLRHLDFIAQNYVRFYNESRPHQGLSNRTLSFSHQPVMRMREHDDPVGEIRCNTSLAGLLKSYERVAA